MCSHCKLYKTYNNFLWSNYNNDYIYYCHDCRKKIRREYYLEHKKEENRSNRKWAKEHPQNMRDNTKKHKQKNKEKYKQKGYEYYQQNKENILKKAKIKRRNGNACIDCRKEITINAVRCRSCSVKKWRKQ